TMVAKLKASGGDIVIASDDKDMCQLMDEHVLVYSSRQDKVLGVQEGSARFGINPTLIADYIGLCGDASDNIPGVHGIGEVTARNLINQFGTLENIYAHLQDVKPPRVKEKLENQKDEAFFSKGLAVLHDDVPLEADLEMLSIREPNRDQLRKLFEELEFRKIAAEYQSSSTAVATSLFSNLRPSDLKEVVSSIEHSKKMTLLSGKGNVPDDEFCIYVACDGKFTSVSQTEVSRLKSYLEDQSIRKITYDSKSLRKSLDRRHILLNGENLDVHLAGYLLLSGLSSLDISTMTWKYLGEETSHEDEASHVLRLEKLADVMTRELEEKKLWELYRNLELPLSRVLFEIEKEGVHLDVQALMNLSKECDLKLTEIVAKIYGIAGCEFNINSPKQLSEVLFVKLQLPVVKKTKTGFSTDEEVLSRLAAKHEIAQVIIDYRQISKLKSTYIDALPRMVDPKTNRLHATFNQTGAETGRLSSHNPNLQNIPIRTEMGREIRRAFVPFSASDVLLSADYSQIELRILAHLSQDENLIKAFEKDQDIHAYTAGLIFDVKETDVDAQMRNAAKRVNFGIIYGISSFGLGKDLGVSNQEAQDFIDRYFLRYPKVKLFMDHEIKKAQDQGYVTTIFNRRRYIPDIKSKNIGLRQFAERQAINTPVQGSAADLMKMAMIRMQESIHNNRLNSRMIITVHDELVFNVSAAEKNQMASLVREAMEKAYQFLVPITVSVKVGKNWLQMEKL
ncbi:MAG: DNA polymerase I, partial [Candidatus Omnitrophica bacterium]|nr:DNA polymerase I [Candidatus Omnitrophota bacterium]